MASIIALFKIISLLDFSVYALIIYPSKYFVKT